MIHGPRMLLPLGIQKHSKKAVQQGCRHQSLKLQLLRASSLQALSCWIAHTGGKLPAGGCTPPSRLPPPPTAAWPHPTLVCPVRLVVVLIRFWQHELWTETCRSYKEGGDTVADSRKDRSGRRPASAAAVACAAVAVA